MEDANPQGEKLRKENVEGCLRALLKLIATGTQSWVVGDKQGETGLDKQQRVGTPVCRHGPQLTTQQPLSNFDHAPITAKLGTCMFNTCVFIYNMPLYIQ